MNRKIKYISIVVLVLIILGIIILPKIITTQGSEKSTQQNTNTVISADAYIIKTQTLDNEIKTIGTILANEEVEVRSEVSRKVRGIYFKEGTFVRQGQTLFKLDSDDLNARLNKQEIQENLAKVKLEREQKLIDRGLTSQEEYDVIQSELDQIKADIQITRVDISKTYIRAPFSGLIGLRNVSRGSFVTPSNVLVTIQDVSKVKIDFSIPEKYTPYFQKGQIVKFKVDGINEEFEAEINAYEPKVEGNTRTLVLRAICYKPGRKLMPGTFANVTFSITRDKDAILIPTQGLVPKLKGQSVYVLKNGKAKQLDVQIGERTDEYVQITSGNLNPGDTVIITNILRMKNDLPVKVSKVVSFE